MTDDVLPMSQPISTTVPCSGTWQHRSYSTRASSSCKADGCPMVPVSFITSSNVTLAPVSRYPFVELGRSPSRDHLFALSFVRNFDARARSAVYVLHLAQSRSADL